MIANEVCSDDMSPHAAWRPEPDTLRTISLGGFDQLLRDNSVFENLSCTVDIIQKQIQCTDTLLQTGFNRGPFVPRNRARNHVKRPDFLIAVIMSVDGKRDPLL